MPRSLLVALVAMFMTALSGGVADAYVLTGNVLANPSFDPNTTGWNVGNATLTRVVPGTGQPPANEGSGVAAVTWNGSAGGYYINPSAEPVALSVAGYRYTALAWLAAGNAAAGGSQAFLAIREWHEGSVVKRVDVPLTLSISSMQAVQANLTAINTGDVVDTYIYRPDGTTKTGEKFWLDSYSFAANPPPAWNITGNPSLEVSATGWGAGTNGTTAYKTASGSPNGAGYAQRTWSGAGTAYSLGDESPWTPIHRGYSYTATAWVKAANTAANGKTLGFQVKELKGSTVLGSGESTIKLSSSKWQEISVAYSPVQEGSALDLSFQRASALTSGEAFAVDDISLELNDKSSCGPSVTGLGGGKWPTGCWRPYLATSPFNQAVPAEPKLETGSAGMVSKLVAGAAVPGSLVVNDPFKQIGMMPTFYATAGDPKYTVDCFRRVDFGGPCSLESFTEGIPLPTGTQPAGPWPQPFGWDNTDAHMTIIGTDGTEYDLFNVTGINTSKHVIEAGYGGYTSVTAGSGVNAGNGSSGTAAGFGNLAGTIRAEELEDGVINHALGFMVPCTSATPVSPAIANGLRCSEVPGLGWTSGQAPAMGAHFYLNVPDYEIANLNVPVWQRAILRAMAHYGGYVADTTGSNSEWGFRIEADNTYSGLGVTPKMVTLAKQLGLEAVDYGPCPSSRMVKDGEDGAGKPTYHCLDEPPKPNEVSEYYFNFSALNGGIWPRLNVAKP